MDSNSPGSPYTPFEDMEAWCAERDTLRACAKSFSSGEFSVAYQNAYSRMEDRITFPEYIQSVIDKFGFERVCLVMAATVRSAPWDERYYKSVKECAANVRPFPQSPRWEQHKREDDTLQPKEHTDILINSHPVYINDACRLLTSREREMTSTTVREGSER
jgi:hypothetical protein